MAKELPYFKFEPAEYLTKDISFCSLSAQGLFIIICSYYWQRGCNLTITQLKKRINCDKELEELIQEDIIKMDEESIKIDFLDVQLNEVEKTSKTNSDNGKKGGRPKKNNPKESQIKPTALFSLSETKGIREDKIKEEEIKELNKVKTLDFDKLLFFIKQETRREFRTINKSVQNKYKARLRDGYLKADIQNAIKYACSMQYHKDNGFQYLTPEFFSRADTLDKYGSKSTNEVKTNHNLNPAN